MTSSRRARMLRIVPTPATQRRLLQMPRYESLDSQRGHGLGCFRGLMWGLLFEAAIILCGVLCWMFIRHS